jgi:DNA-binding response OmpR family regulator
MLKDMNILIVEDNANLAASLWDDLESKGHVIDAAGDGVTGLHLATVNDYDAIILDLILPGLDGLELCRKLRADALKYTPVLMLTARDTLEDKLKGFEHGTDDYLVKPFALEELEARLDALARRANPTSMTRRVRAADLTLDLDTLELRRAGQSIDLTPTGLQILELLMGRPGCVVTRRELVTAPGLRRNPYRILGRPARVSDACQGVAAVPGRNGPRLAPEVCDSRDPRRQRRGSEAQGVGGRAPSQRPSGGQGTPRRADRGLRQPLG